jgi:hypothetical protein
MSSFYRRYGGARLAASRAVELEPENAAFKLRYLDAAMLERRFPEPVMSMLMPGGGTFPLMSMFKAVLGAASAGDRGAVHVMPIPTAQEASEHACEFNAGAAPRCGWCKQQGNTAGIVLARCSGCYVTLYCSRKCQKLAWLEHKTTCHSSRAALEGANAAILEKSHAST